MVSRVQKVEKKCLDLLFKKLWKSDVWLLPGPPPSFQHLFTKSHSLIAFQCPFMRDDLSSEISFTSSRHLILCQSHISSQESFGVKISLIKLNFQTWIMVITLVFFFSKSPVYIFSLQSMYVCEYVTASAPVDGKMSQRHFLGFFVCRYAIQLKRWFVRIFIVTL